MPRRGVINPDNAFGVPEDNGGETFPCKSQVVVRRDSKKLYIIEKWTNRDGVTVVRGDGYRCIILVPEFREKYRKATVDEASDYLYVYETEIAKFNKSGGLLATELPCAQEQEVGILIETDENDTFEFLVLTEGVAEQNAAALRAIELRHKINDRFGIAKIQPQEGKCIVNYYGPPGTGKTRLARATARKLGKRLYLVDYSSVLGRYVGDTAKAIARAFERAKFHDAVLFWDEADSLFSRRISMDNDGGSEAWGTGINQNRNVLMQELDRFDGVMLAATNHFKNFDPALVRRISRNIEFKLPTREMRVKLFAHHFPVAVGLKADFETMADLSEGFSGGDIMTSAVNSMNSAAIGDDPETWFITPEIIEKEIFSVKSAKQANSGGGKSPIGFTQLSSLKKSKAYERGDLTND